MKEYLKITVAFGSLLFPVVGYTGEATKLQHETEVVNPAAAEEVSQLDFLIGDWVMNIRTRVSEDEVRENHADLSVRYILEGFAIQIVERFPPGDNSPQPYLETTILNYDSTNKKWAGASVNTLGNRKFVEGEFKDGEFILVQTGKLFRGGTGSNRLTFYNITPDSYDYKFEFVLEDWHNWHLGGYAYTAVRKKSSAE